MLGWDPLQPWDYYCERPDFLPDNGGLWAEPANAITNFTFFVAAWGAWRLAREHGPMPRSIGLLTFLLVVIGLGSSLFHTLANEWSKWADVLPILAFQCVFLWVYGRRLVGLPVPTMRLVEAGFLIATLAGEILHLYLEKTVSDEAMKPLYGSLSYVPALAVTFWLGAHHLRHQSNERHLLLASAFVLLASVGFRGVAMSVCGALPHGTHFMWHILNGVALYLAMAAHIPNLRRA